MNNTKVDTFFNFKSYDELILHARSEYRYKGDGTYYELHHIIPKHLGGTDNKKNLVLLTFIEHVEAHYLLALENKNKGDLQEYYINIASSYFILKCFHNFKSAKSKKEKELLISSFLQDKEKYEFYNYIASEYRAAMLNRTYIIKGNERRIIDKKDLANYIQNGWANAFENFLFIQKNNQKPEKKSEAWIYGHKDSLNKNGYKIIENCPICHKDFYNTSFACCEEHEKEYLDMLDNNMKNEQSNRMKHIWTEDHRKKVSKAISEGYKKRAELQKQGLIEKKIWINDGAVSKPINESDFDKFSLEGWVKGRLLQKTGPRSEETKQRMRGHSGVGVYVNKDGITKRVQKDELENYLSEGWIKGSPNSGNHLEKGYKQLNRKSTIWIHNESRTRMCSEEELDKLLSEGWLLGRTTNISTSEENPILSQDDLDKKLSNITVMSRIFYVCQGCGKIDNKLYKVKGLFNIYCRSCLKKKST